MQMSPTMDQSQTNPDDERLFVQFYMGSIKNEDKSLTEGHPVFDARPFVKILVPGDRNTVVDTLADPQYQRRFPRQWQMFQQNEQQQMEGFPLREWPAITRAQAEEMNHLNVYTVEQLSTLPDVYGAKLMGFQTLKRKAETFLAAAKDSAFAEKVAAQNEELKNQLAATQQELARLSAKFDKMNAKG
jgi:hypothetical protein